MTEEASVIPPNTAYETGMVVFAIIDTHPFFISAQAEGLLRIAYAGIAFDIQPHLLFAFAFLELILLISIKYVLIISFSVRSVI